LAFTQVILKPLFSIEWIQKMNCEVRISVDSAIYPLVIVRRLSYALAPTLTMQIRVSENQITLDVVPTLLAGGPGEVISAKKARELVMRNLNDFVSLAQTQRGTPKQEESLVGATLREGGIGAPC
jgi:hypothetical protein